MEVGGVSSEVLWLYPRHVWLCEVYVWLRRAPSGVRSEGCSDGGRGTGVFCVEGGANHVMLVRRVYRGRLVIGL